MKIKYGSQLVTGNSPALIISIAVSLTKGSCQKPGLLDLIFFESYHLYLKM